MDSTANGLPIHRAAKPPVILLVLGLAFAPIAVIVIVLTFGVSPVHGMSQWLGWVLVLFVPVVCLAVYVSSLGRRASLDVDSQGVEVTSYGRSLRYRWSDIADVRVLQTRSKMNCLRLVLKGEIENNQRPNLIWPEFGILAPELKDLILAHARGGVDSGSVADQALDAQQAFGHRGGASTGSMATIVSASPVDTQVEDSIGLLKRRTLVSLALLAAIVMGLDIFGSGSMILDYRDQNILKERGVPATGTVERRYIESGRHGAEYPHLVYSYAPIATDGSLGRSYFRDESVGRNAYDAAQIGDRVPVYYDPQQPTRWRANITNLARAGDPQVLFEVLGLINGLCLVMLAIFGAVIAPTYFSTRNKILAERAPSFSGFAAGGKGLGINPSRPAAHG